MSFLLPFSFKVNRFYEIEMQYFSVFVLGVILA